MLVQYEKAVLVCMTKYQTSCIIWGEFAAAGAMLTLMITFIYMITENGNI